MKNNKLLDTADFNPNFIDYKVETVSFKNDIVLINLLSDNRETIKLHLLVDDYFDYGLKKDSKVNSEIILKLQKKEASILAYRSAIRRLAIKDYSVHQMKDSLRKKYDISEEELNDIIKKLKDNKLLNDSEYAKNKINYLSNASLSIKSIKQKLISDGIAKDIIDRYLIEDSKKELEKIKKKADKYLTLIKGKSVNAKRQAILLKLVNDGFKAEDAKKAIEELDFHNDALKEDDLLKLEVDKAYRKYSKKYEGYELKSRVYRYLVSKGFNLDKVNSIINEMER